MFGRYGFPSMSAAIRMSPEEYERHQARVMGAAGRECPEQPKAKATPRPKAESPLEIEFARQLAAAGIDMTRELRPLEDRKFRIDFAIPDRKIGIEIEGAVHRIKGRWKSFHERHALLTLNGWTVLYAHREVIVDGRALAWLKQLLSTGDRRSR